jgi:predicted transcriptional regulator
MSDLAVKPRDPVAEACARAPRIQELTPEDRAHLDAIMDRVRAGELVRHEDVPAWLEEQARRERGDG